MNFRISAARQLLLVLTVSLSVGTFAQNKEDSVLAEVGNKKIMASEFNKKFQEVKSQTLNPPTKAQFLEDLIRYYVGVQEAEKKGLRNDPMVVEQMQKELYKGLLEKQIGPAISQIKVNDAEMKAWYQKNPEIRTSHILIEFKPSSTPEEIAAAKKRATDIYTEVKGSKRPFEELVRLYSDDPLSKQLGGDVGWQSRLTLVPSYYDTVLGMKVGEVKGLIETPFGFHIIKVTGRRTYENANKRQIRTAVFDEKRKQIFDNFFAKLKKDYPIKINAKSL